MPGWWWFLLLSLASYRVWRLLAEDSILDGTRRRLLRLGDWTKESGEELPDEYHDQIADFVSCPYCFGFWISGGALGLYAAIIDWPGWLEFFVAWFAISAAVAFFAKIDEKLNE